MPTHTQPDLGLLRVAACAPEVTVANPAANADATAAAFDAATRDGARLVVFPELGLTGYTCADLFFQDTLRAAALDALARVAATTRDSAAAAVVGLPLEVDGRIFNVAAVCARGRIAGLVPKSHLPNYGEFYEQRWFATGAGLRTRTVRLGSQAVPFGTGLLFAAPAIPGFVLGIEICEDLWAVHPPSGNLALAGATVLANLSSSNELLGKAAYRRDLIRSQSARCLAAYVYAGAGPGESTTDIVFGGHGLVAENGRLLAESQRFRFESTAVLADVDLDLLRHERVRNTTFTGGAPEPVTTPGEPGTPPRRRTRGDPAFRTVDLRLPGPTPPRTPLLRPLARHPFVPGNPAERDAHCQEVFSIQSTGLARRLRHTRSRTVTIGISGGLDSTLALLVALRAFDTCGLPRSGIVGVTLPGLGTTSRTRDNARALVQAVRATLREIDIGPAVRQHFADIGHPPDRHDVTFENSQARERTQVLMDIANQTGGFVVGTGDLSESALGWCTFNGDHMSMYHVNVGVPKTLVRYLIDWCAAHGFEGAPASILHDIVATPITPELLPLDAAGGLQQRTEDTIGPYELHDFFLWQVVRHGHRPGKVLFLARQAFAGAYDDATLLRWLVSFYRRFFSQQFKRSSMPDGPKVGSVALSPRGDWRMPSDASAAAWLAEAEGLLPTA